MRKIYFMLSLLIVLTWVSPAIFAQNGKSSSVLIMDFIPDNGSGNAMAAALDELEVAYDIETSSIPADLSGYDGIFICLGIYSNNHVLTDDEGQTFANYLDGGGSIYMEGGDTWEFNSPTPVHPYFHIFGEADGSGDMTTVTGQSGTFTEGMSFVYNGENNWMDHISPLDSAFLIFENSNPTYGTGVAYDGGTYKTIGTGHLFGGLTDGTSPSTKLELMEAYCQFLGIPLEVTAAFIYDGDNICAGSQVQFTDDSGGQITSWQWTFEGGDPATSDEQNPLVTYNSPGSFSVSLIVSDGSDADTLTIENAVEVSDVPAVPSPPAGLAILCDVNNSAYSVNEVPLAESYDWVLVPDTAGNIVGNSQNVIVQWTEGFYGTAQLKVASVNYCGLSEYSIPIVIQRYPSTAILEFADPYITTEEEPFLLNEGIPAGGVYEGTGVILSGDNYYFDPSISGIGDFIISYTFDGPCGSSTVSDTLFVSPVGIQNHQAWEAINIYPNPTGGTFFISSKTAKGNSEIHILNLMGEEIYHAVLNLQKTQQINIEDLEAGVYIIRINEDTSEYTRKLIIK